LSNDFPDYDHQSWFEYNSPLENKKTINNWNLFPPKTYSIVSQLTSPDFVSKLQEITGIKLLYPDFGLHGAGWHAHNAGGGGVGVYGEGSSGARGADEYVSSGTATATGGGGGSGGGSGVGVTADENGSTQGGGGNYGGGAGYNAVPETGAVRIIWGANRSFPSTNVTQDFGGVAEGLN